MVENQTIKIIKHANYSKRIHLATLCCFLFPFFYTGCGPDHKEKEAMEERAVQDSSSAIQNPGSGFSKEKVIDTSLINKKDAADETTIYNHVKKNKKFDSDADKQPSAKISTKFPFLKPLLIPEKDTYTGIALVIDSAPFIIFFSTAISMLFLILSFVTKCIDKKSLKISVLLDTLSLIFLFFSEPYSINSEKLWGYWVALTFVFILTAYDLYTIKLKKQSN